jgi:hypothetical protein
MPRAKLNPSDEQRGQVKALDAYGIEATNIAHYFHISEKTLRKYYRVELFRGPLEANAKVGKTLFEMATSGNMPASTMFWFKTRSGWSEKRAGDSQPEAVPDFVVALEKKAA